MQRLILRLMLFVVMALCGPAAMVGVARATHGGGAPGHLIVADSAAHALYAFGLDNFALDSTLDDITVNAHAGFLALPDGRVLFVDDETEELLAVLVNDANALEVVGRVSVPAPVSHFAVNPEATHALVGAMNDQAPLTLVELDSYTSRSFQVEAGEAGVILGDDPLTIFHRNDALQQVESYPVSAIVRGSTTPTGVVDTGAFGHGEAIDHERGRLYLATDDGFDVVDIIPEGLAYRSTYAWDVSDRSGGRAYFARLAPDGDHLLSYIANREAKEGDWGEWTNDVYLIDLETEEASRVELAPGLVYRFALADRFALFFNQHPDGDQALLLDTDPESATFGKIVSTISLDPLSNGPVVGASPWEAESRITAITPDSEIGFVSHGGDGLISVIDTEEGTVTAQIDVPTPLTGGGAMIAIQDDMTLVDTIAR